ncbi:unnamed protein product [Phytophthora fragariaefolia]|uniref:Unnamed protein product n=1 Tax=Phytophthora fragariaefolia TaxID=1490495 RepID=A0A9W7CXP5_9STRA|nr:unnamed protein product [Phytophthora fragariaefolia]
MTERVVRENCEPNQKTQIGSDLWGSKSVKSDAVVLTSADTQVEQREPVSALDASVPGADAIGPNVERCSAVSRRGNGGASAPGVDAASSTDSCKHSAPEKLVCSRAAGLHSEAAHNQSGHDCVRPRVDPAADQKEDLSTAEPGQKRHAEPGDAHENRTMQASQPALGSVKDRAATSSIGQADTATGDNHRDPECLDAYGFWSPVSEDGA